MIVSVFGDESADETKQRVFAVSGVVGTEKEWGLAVSAWNERTNGKIFHAAHCETEYANDSDPRKHKDNLLLYKDLTQILAQSYLVGSTVALDLVSYREFFSDIKEGVEYYKCFTDLIAGLTRMARSLNETASPEDAVKLEFTFDHRKETEAGAGMLYSALINEPVWASASLLDTKISFECRTNPRIQMADLLAREAMKDLDRIVSKSGKEPRKSKQALDQTGKFIFVKRDREYCQQWAAMMEQMQTDSGITKEGYIQWLKDTGRVQNDRPHDSWTNRFRYWVWFQNRNELGKSQ
jgi:hypothetical protein